MGNSCARSEQLRSADREFADELAHVRSDRRQGEAKEQGSQSGNDQKEHEDGDYPVRMPVADANPAKSVDDRHQYDREECADVDDEQDIMHDPCEIESDAEGESEGDIGAGGTGATGRGGLRNFDQVVIAFSKSELASEFQVSVAKIWSTTWVGVRSAVSIVKCAHS